jgi:hypothetical protein
MVYHSTFAGWYVDCKNIYIVNNVRQFDHNIVRHSVQKFFSEGTVMKITDYTLATILSVSHLCKLLTAKLYELCQTFH